MTPIDYASSPDFRADVTRAAWAVIQTGLITSGLALFGVYVLATRINDLHLMSLYAFGGLPVGPLLVGFISGSGYILASWWFGVRVTGVMLAAILVLQLGTFFACHYANFETLDLVYRESEQRVGFATFFDFTTRRLGQPGLDLAVEPPRIARGYAIRGVEAACFTIGGLLAALTLVGRPKCGLCGGLVKSRCLGKIAAPRIDEALERLEERAKLGDARGFGNELAAQGDELAHRGDGAASVELTLFRCEVCGVGKIELADWTEATTTSPSAPAGTTTSPPSAATLPHPLDWHVDVKSDFARQLFDQKPRPRPRPPQGEPAA